MAFCVQQRQKTDVEVCAQTPLRSYLVSLDCTVVKLVKYSRLPSIVTGCCKGLVTERCPVATTVTESCRWPTCTVTERCLWPPRLLRGSCGHHGRWEVPVATAVAERFLWPPQLLRGACGHHSHWEVPVATTVAERCLWPPQSLYCGWSQVLCKKRDIFVLMMQPYPKKCFFWGEILACPQATPRLFFRESLKTPPDQNLWVAWGRC